MIDSSLPTPRFMDSVEHPNLEYNGYRSKAGTSIVIKLNPGKLGVIDLEASVEKYIYGTRMPMFYNGKRVGYTYSEIMEEAHKLKGENVYELSDIEKETFDKAFPNAKGQYPKIVITVEPFDIEEYQPGLSGLHINYDVKFDRPLQWQVKDQTYMISSFCCSASNIKALVLHTENTKEHSTAYIKTYEQLLKTYGTKKVYALLQVLDQFMACPTSTKELGDAWLPFAQNEEIHEVWRIFVDNSQNSYSMHIELNKRFNSALNVLTNNCKLHGIECFYQGVFTGNLSQYISESYNFNFFLENKLQPIVDIGRTKVLGLPLIVLIAVCVFF